MSKCVKCGNEILTGDIHWEMGLCNNCYNELYKDHKTHISLDKMWLKLAQDFRDKNEKLQDKVADLEARLAESEKKFIVANNLRKNSDEVLLNYKTKKYGLDKTIQELRKMKLSLPEKEWYYKGFENCERQMSSHIADLTLEVKQLKRQLAEKDKEISNLNGLVRERDKQIKNLKTNKKRVIEHKNKTKISFAVEQLEKLKVKLHIIHTNGYLKAIDEEIDDQIKELKGEETI